MAIKIEQQQKNGEPGVTIVMLSGSATVRETAAIHQELMAVFADTEAFRIETDGIDAADAAFIQLLCSAVTTAYLEGKRLEIVADSSGAVAEAARCIGVALK